jgi:hypothetical protein
MRRWVASGLVCAWLGAPARAALTQAEAQAAVAAVLPELTAIRGLDFLKPVPVRVIDDAQAREYALARFRRLTPEAKIRADQAVFKLLGLIPPNVDVLKTLLDVLEEQAGGFYDPSTKSFYLLNDMPHAMTGFLAAHEMTHALEDQRYDIDGRLEKLGDDDDAAFALSSVAEGSATIAAVVYLRAAAAAGTLAPKDLEVAGEMEQVRTERLNAMPAVMRRQLLGPYILGMSFLDRGLPIAPEVFPKADVDAAWTKAPVSSEQILHPEKYWDPARRDLPKKVAIEGPAKVLGAGWERAGSGILGELTIGSMVGAPAPDATDIAAPPESWTNDAASGWGGDHYELWTRGESQVVLLATVWDTEKDAIEFERALAKKRAGISAKRQGLKVGIVAGDTGPKRDKLLALLVKP